METINDRRRTSQGKVQCSLCRTTIPKGVEYQVETCAESGRIWDFKSCPACEKLLNYICAEDRDFIYDWGVDTDYADVFCWEKLAYISEPSPSLTVRQARIMHDYLVRRKTEGFA